MDLYLILASYAGDIRLEHWCALLQLQASAKRVQLKPTTSTEAIWTRLLRWSCPCPMPSRSNYSLSLRNRASWHTWRSTILRRFPLAALSRFPSSATSQLRTVPKTNDMKADGTAFKEMAEKYGISEVQLLLRSGIQNGYAVL